MTPSPVPRVHVLTGGPRAYGCRTGWRGLSVTAACQPPASSSAGCHPGPRPRERVSSPLFTITRAAPSLLANDEGERLTPDRGRYFQLVQYVITG
ncbi:MAG TPA: hypothetical protein VHZ03_10220 [Trebonia sp.]|nr:hypothetical protein [Trebonia sp.]